MDFMTDTGKYHIGPTSHFYISQRLRLHYLDWGNRQAPPLILQHGGFDHGHSWDFIAQALMQDWHVIVPDLRGHGDSAWVNDGDYSIAAYVYDFAQLIHQMDLGPVTIVGHSLGGHIATRYAGIFPDCMRKLVAIEGVPLPSRTIDYKQKTPADRLREWIERKRNLAARQPKRYPTLVDAAARMQERNQFLSRDMAFHLTQHGVNQNEDGTYSWKFDNYIRSWPPTDMPYDDLEMLWSSVKCPVLMMYGEQGWTSTPHRDSQLKVFHDLKIETFAQAGHWVHHDRYEDVVASLKRFL